MGGVWPPNQGAAGQCFHARSAVATITPRYVVLALVRRSFDAAHCSTSMQVLGVDSQNDMLLQQAAARALTIPTHTFAADRVNKPRTVMAIGPAPEEQLAHITGHLRELIR